MQSNIFIKDNLNINIMVNNFYRNNLKFIIETKTNY